MRSSSATTLRPSSPRKIALLVTPPPRRNVGHGARVMTLRGTTRARPRRPSRAEHWVVTSPAALARVAETSPPTALLFASSATGSLCGFSRPGAGSASTRGTTLRGRGYRAVGADWAVNPPAPAARGRRTRRWRPWTWDSLAFGAGASGARVSLGVEHDAAGPDRILVEAHRVLAPGGTLLVSVPYVNVVRRLAAPRIRRANERVRDAGGTFYQFAFSRREAAAVERAGFHVVLATPYDPARLLRSAWRRWRRRRLAGASTRSSAMARCHRAAPMTSPSPSPRTTTSGCG